jgi:hypothetical protein
MMIKMDVVHAVSRSVIDHLQPDRILRRNLAKIIPIRKSTEGHSDIDILESVHRDTPRAEAPGVNNTSRCFVFNFSTPSNLPLGEELRG